MSAFEKLGIYHFFGVFSSGKWGFETCDGMRKPIFLNTPILSATSSFDRFSNHKPQFLPDWSTIRRSSQILLDSLGSSRLHGSAASTPKGGRFKTSPHFWPDVRPTGPGIGLQTWRGAPSGWPGAVIIYRAILWLSYEYPLVPQQKITSSKALIGPCLTHRWRTFISPKNALGGTCMTSIHI